MTKEITKAIILQQMQDKFKLRELEPEVFSFSEMVVPVYNIEQHLFTWDVEYSELSVTAIGAYPFFTVPQNEQWVIDGYNVVFMGSGAYAVTGAFVGRASGQSYYLDMTQGQTVSYGVHLPQLLVLQPGDILHLYVDSYTSTQNLRLYIDVRKETIR